MEPSAHAPARPTVVTAAVVFLAISYLVGLIRIVFSLHWTRPLAVAGYTAVIVLIIWILRSIYGGKEFARWLVVIWIGLGTAGIPHFWARYGNGPYWWAALVQIILQETALVLLLLPASFAWYGALRSLRFSKSTLVEAPSNSTEISG